jgi:hypothetical protein
MILGMSTSTFTAVHVLISFVGIGSGVIVLYGLLKSRAYDGATAIYLGSTALTSLTGFLFPVEHLLPSHIVGVISLVLLAAAIVARYVLHLVGAWRWIYVVCVVVAFYLNVLVAVIQSFLKIPALHALAPTQKEPPFLIAQLAVLALFVILGTVAVRKFRVDRMATA